MHRKHTNIHARVLLVSGLGLAAASCSEDTVPVYDVDCEGDAIGWSLDIANLVELPLAEFGVECAGGWGHGVKTRAASEVVEVPKTPQLIIPHPQGGLLLRLHDFDTQWSERLGVEIADDSLVWLDEQAKEIHWLRDDLQYYWPFVVSAEGKTELWVWGDDDELDYLSRIEPSTGELLERVVWPEDTPRPLEAVAAWPQVGGLWQLTLASADENFEYYAVQRMSSFATVGPVLRTYAAPRFTNDNGTTGVYWITGLDPTPEGGVLWQNGAQLESIAEDGSRRWEIEAPHTFSVVDEQGGFLLGNIIIDGDEPDDHRNGLTIERRKLDDGSLLWTRVHHRYEFAHQPDPDQRLLDTAWTYAARAEGGYLLAGGHAYPATSCPRQPIVWAIDINGEVEWAHRVEACGMFSLPSERVEGRAPVLGQSYANDYPSNFDIQARWLQYFDL